MSAHPGPDPETDPETAPTEPAPTEMADDEASISYEDARAELAEIVRALESGGQTLEESLGLWQRGERLADVCQAWLDGARRRLDETIAAQDGDTE